MYKSTLYVGEYPHGYIETIKKDQTEKTVRIEMDLVMTADEEELKKD